MPHRALALVLLAAAACHTSPGRASKPEPLEPSVPAWEPDLPLSEPPYDVVHVNWKERLPQPYVYVEHRGNYTAVGPRLESMAAELAERGIRTSGPPFALYFDDPGTVPIEELYARACFPVESPGGVPAPLASDVLPGGTVVYAFVAGAYPEVPRTYPALYDYLGRFNWVENGPIREIYLVNPVGVSSYDELICEVQIPARMGAR